MTAALALIRGGTDLARPPILALLGRGLLLTLGLLVAMQVAVFAALRALVPGGLTLPWIGTLDWGNALSFASLALLPVMAIVLMAPVAAFFSGLYAETVAERVEAIHYPHLAPRSHDLWDGILAALPMAAAVLAVTIASLALTPLLGPLAPLLFYGGNGWLLGREFFGMAARRHMPPAAAEALRRGHAGTVTAAGIAVALLLTVPLLNILVPMWAAAAFTHLVQRISRGSAGPR